MKRDELTYEEAMLLLETPKVIIDGNQRLQDVVIDFSKAKAYRLYMTASDAVDLKPKFMLSIRVSNKRRTKVSLHTQGGETNCCLFRIDYNGSPHPNPVVDNGHLPDIFRPYVGKTIAPDHVHYHVEGYRSGAWALPIDKDAFPVKSVEEDSYAEDVSDVLKSLSEVIHLETRFIFESSMLF